MKMMDELIFEQFLFFARFVNFVHFFYINMGIEWIRIQIAIEANINKKLFVYSLNTFIWWRAP